MVVRHTIAIRLAICALSAACARPPAVNRVEPGVVTDIVSSSSESALHALVICHDTLGRPDVMGRVVEVSRCTPCIPYGLQASETRSRAHARRLWAQVARAPYDSLEKGAQCTRLAYRLARRARPDDEGLALEALLVEIASAHDAVRATALQELDSILDAHIMRGDQERAATALSQFALGVWDRAQRQLERPRDVDVDRHERDAHQLTRGAPLLSHVPTIPATSSTFGVSEAKWVARLFDAAARVSTQPGERSRRMRLALAPWVVLEEWRSLDSAARALLQFAPGDSAVLPARALAAYRVMRRPVLESTPVSALFDSVVKALPRVDSARYDSFDGILSADDDKWRYGFYPDQQIALERRGWAVVDPLWSTPVNEIRLARRARIVEADYRYADIAGPRMAGSETKSGQLLVRRGVPDAQWAVTNDSDGRLRIERKWPGVPVASVIDAHAAWRVFSGERFSLEHVLAAYPSAELCAMRDIEDSGLYACAMAQPADWQDVPFYGRSVPIDVTVARFRSRGDSADMYVAARVPLGKFKNRDDRSASPADRIVVGLFLTTELGLPLYHSAVRRELPTANQLEWTQQWTARVGRLRMMHRVEAMEVTRPSGARGIARFTSDAQAAFPVRGFGMSDVLVAATATAPPRGARRWSELRIKPNGATVAPMTRFAMVWELYELMPGSDGRVRWRVRIKRERGEVVTRSDMKAVLSGSATAGSRVLAAESDASDVSYTGEAAASDAVLENIVFGLDNAPVGNHVVNVTIDDLVGGRSVTRGVSIRVVRPGA